MLLISTELDDDPLNIDQYCDNPWQELFDQHPFSILRDE
jgi:hypothetical protein